MLFLKAKLYRKLGKRFVKLSMQTPITLDAVCDILFKNTKKLALPLFFMALVWLSDTM
jgi:hypothetical protein